MTTVRKVHPDDIESCVTVLASQPDFFTPETHEEVRIAMHDALAWVAVDSEVVQGFVLAEIRYPAVAEITFAAVRPERRGAGIGTELVKRALADLERQGIVLVEVKTLDASAGYEPYVSTRAFWERRGFRQIDCIDPLPGWRAGNPSAIYVAALAPTVRRRPRGDRRTILST
jgi:GNAT superfamily N-acetyltransferase